MGLLDRPLLDREGKSVGTDFDGSATFGLSVRRVKGIVTATATKNFTGDTSEFSAPKKVVSKGR